ncbi:hypothetical protein MDAP_002421 [Mitosporidium daphniae]
MSQCQSLVGLKNNQNNFEDEEGDSIKKGSRLRNSHRLIYNISGAAKSVTVNSTSYLFSAVSKGIKGTKNGIMGLVNGYSTNSVSEPMLQMQSSQNLDLEPSVEPGFPSDRLMAELFEDKESSDTENSVSDPETCSQDFYSGYLQKWTNYYGGYRKRFFSVDPIRNTLSYYKSEHDWPDKPRAVAPLSRLKILLPLNPTGSFLSASATSSTIERNAPLKFDIIIIKPKGSKHRSADKELPLDKRELEPKFSIWHLKADTNEQSFQWISLLARVSSKSSRPSSANSSPFSRDVTCPLMTPSHPFFGQRPSSAVLSKDWDGIFHDLIAICNTETITKFTFQTIRELLFLLKSCREEELRLHADQIACLKEKLRWLAFQTMPSQASSSVDELRASEVGFKYREKIVPESEETEEPEESEENEENKETDAYSLTLTEGSSNAGSIDSDMSSSGDDLFFECENYKSSPKAEFSINELSVGLEITEASEVVASSKTEIECLPDNLSKSAIGYPLTPRNRLPGFASIDLSTVSVWSVLRQAIGKDLTKLCVPIQFNEPLSMLQRVAEDMEYWELIEQSITEPLPERRLLLISAFALSVYSTTSGGRLGKPFNPLLHETYELVYRDQKSSPPRVAFRYISEQVSHHPPIAASVAEGNGWIFESETRVKMSFWGKYISLIPAGSNRLIITLPCGVQEVYSWKRVTSNIHNIFIGKMRMDHSGEMDITCHSNGYHCRLVFMSDSSHQSNSEIHNVRGHVFPPSPEGGSKINPPSFIIEGAWYSSIWAFPLVNNVPLDAEKFIIWRANERPEWSSSMFHFTSFAMSLNELTPELGDAIAPTDSRWRLDQRALEDGRLEDGISLKESLEKRQRKRKGAESHQSPIWFVKNTEKHYSSVDKIFPIAWKYLGGYWEARESPSKWSTIGLPTIFLDENCT